MSNGIRMWAFWRRLEYLVGFAVLVSLIGVGFYYLYIYKEPTCFDALANGNERGVDCGGSCTRICSVDVIQPRELWVRSFKIQDGQYNAVAYIENRNLNSGVPALTYTIGLYDKDGLITERTGTTVLPPGSVYPIFEGRINTGTRIPTLTTIKLSDDTLWLPAEAGREQFKIERRELKNADTKPVLVASLTNTALDEAKNVEIVATIFDVKGNALTSSRTVVDYFGGRTTRDVVFTWPLPIAKTVRSCEVPTDVVLAIDLSGSMNDDGGDPAEPVSSVLKAASSFVSRLKVQDQIGVVTYATNASTKEVLTADKDRIGTVVQGLTILPADETGSTNTGDAILRAREELSSSRHNPNARKVLVLFTDGLANAPEETPEVYAEDAATALKNDGVEIYVIGLGEKVNESFLRAIASNDTSYFKAGSVQTVDSIYRKVTSALCEDGAAVIEIIPKTSASFAPLQ